MHIHISDYLDFFEENVFLDQHHQQQQQQQRANNNNKEETAFPAFTALLDKAIKKRKAKSLTKRGGGGGGQVLVVAEQHDNNNTDSQDRSHGPKKEASSVIYDHHHHHHQHENGNGQDEVLLPGRSAMEQRILSRCSDAGFTPYISYPEKKHHTHAVPLRKPWNVQLTAAPFHACYVRLVEYVAYKCHVDPCRVHAFVADLDEEVATRSKKRKSNNIMINYYHFEIRSKQPDAGNATIEKKEAASGKKKEEKSKQRICGT
jgi:hypothetical protein